MKRHWAIILFGIAGLACLGFLAILGLAVDSLIQLTRTPAANESEVVTADATAGLAVVGAISLATNVVLGWYSRKAAQAADKSALAADKTATAAKDTAVDTRGQVTLVGDQVKLLKKQWQRQQQMAFPMMRAKVTQPTSGVRVVSVEYVQGSEPAREIVWWIRWRTDVYVGKPRNMVPADDAPSLTERPTTDTRALTGLPFGDWICGDAPDDANRFAMIWKGLDNNVMGEHLMEFDSASAGWKDRAWDRLQPNALDGG